MPRTIRSGGEAGSGKVGAGPESEVRVEDSVCRRPGLLWGRRGERGGEVDTGEGQQRGLRARGVHASMGGASQEGWGWTALGQALRRKRGP